MTKNLQDLFDEQSQDHHSRQYSLTDEQLTARKAQAQRLAQDPTWQARQKEGVKKAFEDPEVLAKRREQNKKLAQDPAWREANKKANQKKSQDPEYRKTYLAAMEKLRSDEDYKKRHAEAMANRVYTEEERQHRSAKGREWHADPEKRKNWEEAMNSESRKKKHAEAMARMKNNPEWRRKQKLAAEKRKHDPKYIEETKKRHQSAEWLEKVRAGANTPEAKAKHKKAMEIAKLKIQKCIVTPEGVFESLKAACAYYKEHLNKGAWFLSDRLNKFPKEFYYISREEYIMLTGQKD